MPMKNIGVRSPATSVLPLVMSKTRPHFDVKPTALLRLLRSAGQSRGIQRYMPPKEESQQSLTKIVATIGPASEQFEPLQKVRGRRAGRGRGGGHYSL